VTTTTTSPVPVHYTGVRLVKNTECNHACCDRCEEFDSLQRNERAMAVLMRRLEVQLAEAQQQRKLTKTERMAMCSCKTPTVCKGCSRTARKLAQEK
jgi:hypothetical protein